MSVLKPKEYNISYFDGAKARYKHNAGYDRYERWYRNEGPNSRGEFWKDYAHTLFKEHKLKNKKVLEIGCAKGFVVEDLRSLGVDAHGLDVSSYAIGQASDAAKPYLTIADVRSALPQIEDKEFDVLFSLRFMECIPEEDIPGLVAQMNRISKFQFHVIDEVIKPNFYVNKSLEEWVKYPWSSGTVLQSNENKNRVLRK